MPTPYPPSHSSSNQRPVAMKTQYTCQSSQQAITKKPSYDQQFHQIYQQIIHHQYFPHLSKHDKIRLNKWLTKLSNISTNDLWKKNRNNYIKLIRLMLDCEVVIAPFLMMPPERDLHKLTTHEINVIIDQVDKVVGDRELKSGEASSGGNNHSSSIHPRYQTEKETFNRVGWMQEAGYVDHHQKQQNSSLEKFKQSEQDCKRTYECSSVTVNATSKLSQLSSPHNSIPPKYPSQFTSKSPLNPKLKTNPSHHLPQQKQAPCLKTSHHNQSRQQSHQKSLSPQNYFRKKQRLNTFETEEMGQEEYLAMVGQSAVERGEIMIVEKDSYDVRANNGDGFYQAQSRQAINILKCGFRLLQKLPHQTLQQSSIKQIETFRKIITQNDFLKQDLQKESAFLDLISSRNTNRTALIEINSMNNTQKFKMNQRKKGKLTVVSQGQTNRQQN